MQIHAPLALPWEARGSLPALVSPWALRWEAGERSWGQPRGPKPTLLLKWVFAPKDKLLSAVVPLVFPRSRMAPFIWQRHCSESDSWVCLVFTYLHVLLLCLFYMKFHFVECFHNLTGRDSPLTLVSAIFKTSGSLGASCNVKCFPEGDSAIAVQNQSPDKQQKSVDALTLASAQSIPALQTDLQSCYLPRNTSQCCMRLHREWIHRELDLDLCTHK